MARRVVGLLAGIGTLLREAEDAGMRVIGNLETRSYFRTVPDVFDLNFPKATSLWSPPDAYPDAWLEPDLVLGHPPCGSHSVLGVAHSLDKSPEERAFLKARRAKRVGLLPLFVEEISRLRPRAFALDNLPKILSTVAPREWWTEQLPDYRLTFIVMTNGYYGTPQRRERLWVVGIRRPGRRFHFHQPEHALVGPASAWAAIADLPLFDDDPALGHVHQAWDEKPFGSYPTLDQPPAYVDGVGELAARYLGLPPMACWPYRTRTTNRVTKKLGRVRLRLDGPSRVISGGTLQHPLTGWTLTARERARLMDWPDDFQLWNGRRIFDRSYQNRLMIFTGKAVPSRFPRYLIPLILKHLTRS